MKKNWGGPLGVLNRLQSHYCHALLSPAALFGALMSAAAAATAAALSS